ncbi:MAG: hypothetical protein ABIU09_09225 [Pyrinomonadaceae bacterium]
MRRIRNIAFSLITSLYLCSGFVVATLGQATPVPAPTLPPGMVGSRADDPRAKLSPGLYDAAEQALGIRHLQLLRKPDSFQLGTDNPNDPRVQKMLAGFGIADPSKIPKPVQVDIAQGAFTNSDLAFQSNHVFVGNYYGINIYDIADPIKARLVTSMVCPGGQGDPSVYKHLMFMSVEAANGRLDCGTQGFTPNPPRPEGQTGPNLPAANKDRFRGVRIFDISDITNPKQVAAIQTCRGSHTHTLVVDPNDKDNVYIYVSGTSFVRQDEELAGCSSGTPDKDPNTALFRIDIIKVPLAAPQSAKVVSSPRLFMDPRTGVINALKSAPSHGTGKASDTNQCHDITVYSALGLAAGACSGNGLLLDIKDPVNPKRIDAVNDPNYAYWHSASFSNDGKKVVFTDEWGGGGGPRCRAIDPNVWGADSIFHLEGNKLKFAGYYKMPAAQTETENCVAHNGSLIPVPGRDILVQAWYQGGISVMDFTDPQHPVEIAYFDRGPVNEKLLVSGGSWSAYWYNGRIYSAEIARGLDILELTPTEKLTQNEIDAAKAVQVAELNVQNQQKIVWPRKLVTAKAYIDQLERSGGLSSEQIASLRAAIIKAEGSRGEMKKLKGFASSVAKNAGQAKNAADAARLTALAEILTRPEA